MPLELSKPQLDVIRTHASGDYPSECCGVLLGKADGDAKRVTVVVPLAN